VEAKTEQHWREFMIPMKIKFVTIFVLACAATGAFSMTSAQAHDPAGDTPAGSAEGRSMMGSGMMGGYGQSQQQQQQGFGPGGMGGYGYPMMGGGYGHPMMGGYGHPMMGHPGMFGGSRGGYQRGRHGVMNSRLYGGRRHGLRGGNLTKEKITAHFKRHLEWHGNKRLKLGAIKETNKDVYTIDIVTKDNSLVSRFEINRHTGAMGPVD
jgi:hypothetical protein